MCGIAGLVSKTDLSHELPAFCSRLQVALRHRGPDDQGSWIAGDGRCGLVHTRLSILDLSPAGHQPMQTDDGRYTITFNGEIYNFHEIREELVQAGVQFRSRSDTEVILRLYEREGDAAVRRLVGMFAFAIWDAKEQVLFLARGPMGIKPLYVWEVEGKLAFASELRAVSQGKLAELSMDDEALVGYLQSGSVPEPLTLIAGVRMLAPGTTLTWKNGESVSKTYWQVDFNHDAPKARISDLRKALDKSIVRHFVSDVPVGIFLSGGIDSTALLALARANGVRDLHTFCISFEDAAYDEGGLAKRTAEHFGATHHEWKLTAAEAQSLLPSYLDAIDQPSNDGFNTYCVSKLARDHGLKVVLSGLGGDELFGSYQSFQLIPKMRRIYNALNLVPPVRALTGKLLASTGTSHRIQRLGKYLRSAGSTECAYSAVRSFFTSEEIAKLALRYLGKPLGHLRLDTPTPTPHYREVGNEVSYLELTRYMLNQLLRDSDVMSMIWGLELRVPFVDRELFETVRRIPVALRLERGKKVLLDAIPEIPDWVANAPKKGFRFPFEEWISEHWQSEFQSLEKQTPFDLRAWYRKWCLFALHNFMDRMELAPGVDSAASAHR